jgi:hypothetical protein
VQWGRTIISLLILVSTSFNQQAHKVEMAIVCCTVQWGYSLIRRVILVGTSINQQAHNVEMAI